jgi:hypothetical protein
MNMDITGPGTKPPSDVTVEGLEQATGGKAATKESEEWTAAPLYKDAQGNAGKLGLTEPQIKLSSADLIRMLNEMRFKTEQSQLKTASEDVQNIKKNKENASKERLRKIQEQIDKMKKAKKAGAFGKIFGWIAAAFMVVAGALLTLAGGSGTALIVGGIAMMAVMALAQTGAMDKMLEGMAKMFGGGEAGRIIATILVGAVIIAGACVAGAVAGPAVGVMLAAQFGSLLVSPENLQKMGVKEDVAPWLSLGLNIGLVLTSMGAGIGSALKKSAEIPSKVAQLATKAAQKIATLTKTSVEQVQKASALMGYISVGIQAGATVGGGVSTISAAEATKDAAKSEAEIKEFEKFLLKLQQMFQDEADRIEEIIRRMEESTAIVMDVLKQEDATTKQVLSV